MTLCTRIILIGILLGTFPPLSDGAAKIGGCKLGNPIVQLDLLLIVDREQLDKEELLILILRDGNPITAISDNKGHWTSTLRPPVIFNDDLVLEVKRFKHELIGDPQIYAHPDFEEQCIGKMSFELIKQWVLKVESEPSGLDLHVVKPKDQKGRQKTDWKSDEIPWEEKVEMLIQVHQGTDGSYTFEIGAASLLQETVIHDKDQIIEHLISGKQDKTRSSFAHASLLRERIIRDLEIKKIEFSMKK